MGLYFRKSQKIGPFRINYSKSGIGVSAGIKGARISKGPKGTYINLSKNGIYYKKKIGSSKRKNKQITHTSVMKSTNSFSADKKNKTANKPVPYFEFLFNSDHISMNSVIIYLCVIIFPSYVFSVLKWDIWKTLFLFALLFLLAKYITSIIDSKHLSFSLEGKAQDDWNRIVKSIMDVSKSGYYSLKISDGSGGESVVDNPKIELIKAGKTKDHVKTDADLPVINDRKYKIIFTPTGLIVVDNKNYCYLMADGLEVEKNNSFAICPYSMMPEDAKGIQYSYAYTTKDGSPDLRYKYNPITRVIFDATEIVLNYQKQFLISMKISNYEIADDLSRALTYYASVTLADEEIINGEERFKTELEKMNLIENNEEEIISISDEDPVWDEIQNDEQILAENKTLSDLMDEFAGEDWDE